MIGERELPRVSRHAWMMVKMNRMTAVVDGQTLVDLARLKVPDHQRQERQRRTPKHFEDGW